MAPGAARGHSRWFGFGPGGVLIARLAALETVKCCCTSIIICSISDQLARAVASRVSVVGSVNTTHYAYTEVSGEEEADMLLAIASDG